MLLVVLLLVSKAGAECVGGPQELRTGEVMVMCPLSEDARLSRRSVVISHFSRHDQRIPDTMLGCDWSEWDSQKPDCRSRFNFTLASLQKDCVMARVPRAQLHKDGFYQCQLVPPPDKDHAFSRCLVFDNDDTEDPTTTLSPLIPATDQPLARVPTGKVLTDDYPGDNSVLVTGLTSAGVVLLVLIVVFVAFMILRHRRMVQRLSDIFQSLEKHSRREQRLSEIIYLLEDLSSRQNVQQEPEITQDLKQKLRQHVQRASENPQDLKQKLRQHVQRASENPQDLKQKLRIIAKMVAEIDQESSNQGTAP